MRKITKFIKNPISPVIFLAFIIICLYFKFFIFGLIPFPGDLLVSSYSPWFDHYKLPVQNPLISDVFSQFFLWKYLTIDIFRTGNWPLWNPYSFTGTPLLATYHSASLYPLNLVLLLPKYLGWGIFISSQTLISAICMYLLLSIFVKSKLARLTGSIIYSLSGPMTTWLELGTAVHAMAWLPLAFWSLEKFRSDFKFRYILFLISSAVLIILSGNAQVSIYSLVLIFLYIFIIFKGIKIQISLLPFFGLILSILLASLQVLPTMDLLGKSIRISENYTQESNFGLLTSSDFLKFFVADIWGNPVTRNYWGSLNYSETSGFLGTLTLPLFIFSFLYLEKTPRTKFFIFIYLLSLCLAFDNPLSKLIYRFNFPFLTSSYASRILFISNFTISILSSLTINQILLKKEWHRLFNCLIWSFSTISGLLLSVIIICIFIYTNIHLSPNLEIYLKDPLNNLTTSARNSIIPFGLITSALLAIIILNKLRLKSLQTKKLFFLSLIIFGLITIDLSRYFLKFNPFVKTELIFPQVEELDFFKKRPGVFRVGREHAQILPPNTWIPYGIQSIEGYDPLYLLSYAKFINFLNNGKVDGISTSRYAELSSNYQSPYLDSANVKYFVGLLRNQNGDAGGEVISGKFKETGYKIIYKGKSFVIFQNPYSLERVYFAKNFLLGGEQEIDNIFIESNNFNPKQTALISTDLGLKKVTGKGKASIIFYSPNKVVIKTKTNSDELLVLADQFDDGWKAKVDGNEASVARANLIFRAVKIPKGEHKIEFYYWPKSFDLGLKLSTISLLILLVTTLTAIRKKAF